MQKCGICAAPGRGCRVNPWGPLFVVGSEQRRDLAGCQISRARPSIAARRSYRKPITTLPTRDCEFRQGPYLCATASAGSDSVDRCRPRPRAGRTPYAGVCAFRTTGVGSGMSRFPHPSGALQSSVSMAHHTRKGPKSTRDGCLLCKPHKHQAERHRSRARERRRWREREAAASADRYSGRSKPT
jgi:hypothetical protein